MSNSRKSHVHGLRLGSALPRLCGTLGVVFAFAAAAQDARAADSSLYATGLHVPAGALVDPVGKTWVSDHNAGFCRVSDPTDDGAGRIEHPERPGELGVRTCLGGLLPDASPGPDAAGTPAFYDPSPEFPDSGDELAFIPDGMSQSSEVYRAKWNPHTRLFEEAEPITMNADRGRPTVVSVGPDEHLYVGFQRETTIQRITKPAAPVPGVEIVGRTADGRGALALAAGRDALGQTVVHVQESTGLRELRPNPLTPPITAATSLAVPAAAQATIAALSYDLARDLLWLGTAEAPDTLARGTDVLMRYDTRTRAFAPDYATGFSAVGGVAAHASGHVTVVDDEALILATEPMGLGRMYRLGRPVAHATGPEFTTDATPAFALSGDGAIECRLTGPGLAGAWGACTTRTSYAVTTPLADGAYRLAVRASGPGTGPGIVEVHEFSVDTVAPLKPRVVRPQDGGEPVGSRPWFEFDAEADVAFSCRYDAPATAVADEGFVACAPGRRPGFTYRAGEHTIEIKAADRAGNTSETSARSTFTVDPTVEHSDAFEWAPGPPEYTGSSLYATGLHISTGAIADPYGRIWVADHNAGFCRVSKPTEDGPGTIEHPQLPTDTSIATCLGGLLPQAGPGPDAAGQPAFVDPTPDKPGNGDEVALVPDGASHSSEVTRAQWNPDTGLFEVRDVVTLAGERVRPVAVALGPDGQAYVVGQRSGAIHRIVNPAAANPRAEVVGLTSDGDGATAVAAGRNAAGATIVYVAEAGGLRQVRPNANTTPTTSASFNVLGSVDNTAPASIGSLAYDLESDHLYVGTADGTTAADVGKDAVHRFKVGEPQVRRFATGYSMIGGLGILPDGKLLVLDDAALLDPAEPLGTGTLSLVGLPSAHVVRGPLLPGGIAAPNPGFVASPSPRFVVQGEAIVQCRLAGPSVTDSTWSDCGVDGRWLPSAPLADGEYRLLVRAVDKPFEVPAPAPVPHGADTQDPAAAPALDYAVKGLVEATTFTVDTTPPRKPVIVTPTQNEGVGATPWFAFDSGEAGTTYRCRWEGQTEYTTCVEGRTRTFTDNGAHTLRIVSVDRAGNVSTPSDLVRFVAQGRIRDVTILAGPEGPTMNPTATFRFTANALGVEYGCRLVGTGRSWEICTSPKTYSNLADGTYTFEVRGRDGVGNLSPVVSRTFTVDRTAPTVRIAGLAEGATVDAGSQVTISADETATIRCWLDSAPEAACDGPISLAGLPDGEHTLNSVATDAAGNASPVRRVTFVVRRAVVQPSPVAPEPVVVEDTQPEPSVTVVDEVTGKPITIRIADIDRRVDLDRIRAAGVTVQVIPAQGAKLIRFRIFKASGNGRNGGRAVAANAKPKRTLVATVYRATKGGRTTVRLKPRELRRITTGRYVLEVAAGTNRKRLGVSAARQFTVGR